MLEGQGSEEEKGGGGGGGSFKGVTCMAYKHLQQGNNNLFF